MYNERDKKWAKILYNKYLNAEDPISIFRIINPPMSSKSWNFMLKCCDLIENFLTWDVGIILGRFLRWPSSYSLQCFPKKFKGFVNISLGEQS